MPACSPLDRRLTPARADLAAEHLRGIVDAPRYAKGQAMRIVAASAPLRRAPQADAPLETEALFGESVGAFTTSSGGWAWAQLERDKYVGYLPAAGARRAFRADPSGRGAAHPRLSRAHDQVAAAHGAVARRAAYDRRPRGRFLGHAGRALSLVAHLAEFGAHRTGRGRHRRALSRDALSLGRPDVGRASIARAWFRRR